MLLKSRVLVEATSLNLGGISLRAHQLLLVLIVVTHPRGRLYETLKYAFSTNNRIFILGLSTASSNAVEFKPYDLLFHLSKSNQMRLKCYKLLGLKYALDK